MVFLLETHNSFSLKKANENQAINSKTFIKNDGLDFNKNDRNSSRKLYFL